MRISDWSSDVCSSDLPRRALRGRQLQPQRQHCREPAVRHAAGAELRLRRPGPQRHRRHRPARGGAARGLRPDGRSEEHTSELQSLMRISYAVFCLKTKKSTKLNDTFTENNAYK